MKQNKKQSDDQKVIFSSCNYFNILIGKLEKYKQQVALINLTTINN